MITEDMNTKDMNAIARELLELADVAESARDNNRVVDLAFELAERVLMTEGRGRHDEPSYVSPSAYPEYNLASCRILDRDHQPVDATPDDPEGTCRVCGFANGWRHDDFGEPARFLHYTQASVPEVQAWVEGRDNLIDEITGGFFEEEEPGSVSEDEYQEKRVDVVLAWSYLNYETCWRVQFNQAWGQVPRVNWAETTEGDTEDDVRRWQLEDAPRHVRILSCRRATVEDLPEFVSTEVL